MIILMCKGVMHMNIKPNVVNFHFVDYCNYHCCYCFVKKANRMTSFLNIVNIVDNIAEYFKNLKVRGRINLVGGEIFMCSYLQQIIDYIYSKDIDVSIVTNGYLLTKEFIERNKTKICCIGISVDSLNPETNKLIGRCFNKQTLDENKLINLCEMIKSNNIKLKINHCLSKFNYDEDISKFIGIIKPDRFKIFQMTVIDSINGKCKNMQLSNKEFESCCNKYKYMNPIIEHEEEMKSSYLMIDSDGNFFVDKSVAPIGNAITDNFTQMMAHANIDYVSYNKRYIHLQH